MINRYTKMYEMVRTKQQQTAFETTWEYFCRKHKWRNDPYASNGIRYNLILPRRHLFAAKKVIGTVEFIPYDPKNPQSTVESRNKLGFYKLEEVRQHQDRIWEIDKLCIHEAYQRQGYFDIFMLIFAEHAMRHKPKFLLAFMERKLYRMLRMVYRLDLKQHGNAQTGPTTTLVPVMLDVEKWMNDEETLKTILQGT